MTNVGTMIASSKCPITGMKSGISVAVTPRGPTQLVSMSNYSTTALNNERKNKTRFAATAPSPVGVLAGPSVGSRRRRVDPTVVVF
jgi:hypothetical protein